MHYRESQAIGRAVNEAERILVITHVDPDGDALGSLTAVGQAMQQLGKTVTMAVDGGLMRRFSFLPLADQVVHSAENTPYDLIISVDCGDEQRMGHAFTDLPLPRPSLINIDHHVTNTNFGMINLVDADSASATEILTLLFTDLDVRMTPDIAQSLLTGLVTDTLGFRTLNVTPRTFETASRLMQAGADLPTITMLALNLKPLSTLKMWNVGLTNMRMKNGLIWTTISKADRDELGYSGTGSGGLVSMMGDVDTAAISVVLTELDDGRISVSFRCRPPYSVSDLAMNLGGGGHPMASGCTLDGPLDKAESLVVSLSLRTIEEQWATANHN
jgi:phosphoesterase RecJ-like protein